MLNLLSFFSGKACDLIDQHVTSTVASIQSPSHLQQHAPSAFSTGFPAQTMDAIKIESVNNEDLRTRTPSPTHPNYVLQQDHLPELRKPLEKRDSKIKFARSFSASHTPRPSIGSINDLPPLPPLPSEYNDDSKLLPANSLVSILSATFNEEMIANNEQMESEQPACPPKLTRKHSLGSNLADSEPVMNAQSKSEDPAPNSSHIKLEPAEIVEQDPEEDSSSNFSYFGSPGSDSVLEQTSLELEKLLGDDKNDLSHTDHDDSDKVLASEVRHRIKKKSFTGWFKDLGSSSKVNENNTT